jgi:hypothetical protein
VQRRDAGHLDLEPDVAAVDHHGLAAAGPDLHGAAQPDDGPVGGALSVTIDLRDLGLQALRVGNLR